MFTSLATSSAESHLIAQNLWNLAHHFFRKTFEIFDLETLELNSAPPFLSLVDGLKFIFARQKSEVAQLTRDFKVNWLGAKHKEFCFSLKSFMENETWTSLEIGIVYNVCCFL